MGSHFISSNELGVRVCEILGIPPNIAERIEIVLAANEPARITIAGYVRRDNAEWEKIAAELRQSDITVELHGLRGEFASN